MLETIGVCMFYFVTTYYEFMAQFGSFGKINVMILISFIVIRPIDLSWLRRWPTSSLLRQCNFC